MTFQVGMLGTHSLVLAGDTLHYVDPTGERWRIRSSYNSSKIKISDSGRIAITCARNMHLAGRIAEGLLSGLAECDVQDRRTRILEIGGGYAMQDKQGGECIIAFSDPTPSLYRFTLDSTATSYCDVGLDRCFAGDYGNPAGFWAERYYSSYLPLGHLTNLAAHIIISAGKMNNGSVSGLEIVTCNGDGFYRWSEDDNLSLAEKTKAQAESIGDLILSGS
jgi:hypothetical protein